jgi:hypothetical protein
VSFFVRKPDEKIILAALVVRSEEGSQALALPTGAYAQATRTWVSGVGDDVNPCSRTAPCKTFAGAISKTAAGGEIDVLDPVRPGERHRRHRCNSVVQGNSNGVFQTGGGSILSFKNNEISNNGNDGTPLTGIGLN